MENIEYTKWIQ